MLATHVILSVLVVACNCMNLPTVSGNVIKLEGDSSDYIPHWVPFKNKNGEDLGEFVQVGTKNKVKKRLAPPINFILRAVAEPEGDDYYDKGQGESVNDDYNEKKEWSDLNRPAQAVDANQKVNHTDISQIDEVVDIITKKPEALIIEAINDGIGTKLTKANKELHEEVENETKEDLTTEPTNTERTKNEEKKQERVEDDVDYEESSSEKQKPELTEEEKSEDEAKKAKILDSVDKLKERHAEEQRIISEQVKEEELFQEERERNNMQPQYDDDKYTARRKTKKIAPDYEEYEDQEVSLEDKYKLNPLKVLTTTTRSPERTSKRRDKTKNVEAGKLSVFKNPNLYMVYDDDSEETTTTVKTMITSPRQSKDKFSAKYRLTQPTESDDNERISLVPENDDAKEGEPTLFFPKKKKNRRHRIKTTTPASDSYVAETIAGKTAGQLTITPDTTVTETAPSTTGTGDTEADTSAFATDTASTNSNSVTDAVPASSDHKKEKKRNENYENEKGGGREFHSEQEEEHEEHGRKAYEGVHKDTKTAKGHHDKENHLNKYEDHDDVDKYHHNEAGHYGDHHHEEHGKKQAKYEESGKHSKGHSTKGSHDIHKKEEYEKNVEFFEEEGDSAEDDTHGGFINEREHKEGGHFNKGQLEAGHHKRSKGESGSFGKGGHLHVHKGRQSSGGHDGHAQHGHRNSHKGGKDSGKKWVYHHGHPAKTANLVAIDRRADKYYHGPQYYG